MKCTVPPLDIEAGSDTGMDAMDAAREIIERHAEAINARDLDVYRATLNLPFVYQN